MMFKNVMWTWAAILGAVLIWIVSKNGGALHINNLDQVVTILAVSLAIYFFPTIVAKYRKHHNTLAIGVTNLFLGWTFLGWIAALIWSCTKPEQA